VLELVPGKCLPRPAQRFTPAGSTAVSLLLMDKKQQPETLVNLFFMDKMSG
jgi:hypothetical protein